MKAISLLVPEGHLRLVEDLVKEKFYPSKAEAIRIGIRLLLKEHNKI